MFTIAQLVAKQMLYAPQSFLFQPRRFLSKDAKSITQAAWNAWRCKNELKVLKKFDEDEAEKLLDPTKMKFEVIQKEHLQNEKLRKGLVDLFTESFMNNEPMTRCLKQEEVSMLLDIDPITEKQFNRFMEIVLRFIAEDDISVMATYEGMPISAVCCMLEERVNVKDVRYKNLVVDILKEFDPKVDATLESEAKRIAQEFSNGVAQVQESESKRLASYKPSAKFDVSEFPKGKIFDFVLENHPELACLAPVGKMLAGSQMIDFAYAGAEKSSHVFMLSTASKYDAMGLASFMFSLSEQLAIEEQATMSWAESTSISRILNTRHGMSVRNITYYDEFEITHSMMTGKPLPRPVRPFLTRYQYPEMIEKPALTIQTLGVLGSYKYIGNPYIERTKV